MAKTIDLDHVTKIEGHAKLNISVKEGSVERCELSILEGARFFEGILKGKKYNDISHITSRICGVCSVVHAICAVQAVEDAFSIKITEQSKRLRELLNIGGIIQSHALHLYFLTLPDYYGKGSAMELLKDQKELIERALRLKRLGNNMVFTIAGRDVHPIACVVGGFSRIPEKQQMDNLLQELKKAKQDAVETVKLFMALDYPNLQKRCQHFALSGGPYFYSTTMLKCEGNVCFPTTDFDKHFDEHFRKGNTAEFVTIEGKAYCVGSLPRLMRNIEVLSEESKVYANELVSKSNNPFMNIPAQAIEILEGVNRAIELITGMELKEEGLVEAKVVPCGCKGTAAVSAPRGVLFHRYEFDEKGYCTAADITTPTTQNLAVVEETIREFLPKILNLEEEDIKKKIEMLIRAYDPCISCSTHFLEMKIKRD